VSRGAIEVDEVEVVSAEEEGASTGMLVVVVLLGLRAELELHAAARRRSAANPAECRFTSAGYRGGSRIRTGEFSTRVCLKHVRLPDREICHRRFVRFSITAATPPGREERPEKPCS